jgi:hypothetical protein
MKRSSTNLALSMALTAGLCGFAGSAYADGMDKPMDNDMKAMPSHSDSMKSGDTGMMKTDCKGNSGTGMSDHMGQGEKMAKGCEHPAMKNGDKSMSDTPMNQQQ